LENYNARRYTIAAALGVPDEGAPGPVTTTALFAWPGVEVEVAAELGLAAAYIQVCARAEQAIRICDRSSDARLNPCDAVTAVHRPNRSLISHSASISRALLAAFGGDVPSSLSPSSQLTIFPGE